MQNIAILIPAAGASARMRGRDKLLQPVDGTALLRRQTERALATGAHVCVTLPAHEHPRAQALDGLPVQLVAVPDAELGLSASIRRGVAFLPRGTEAVVILPADMPELEAADVTRLVDNFRASPHPMLQQATTSDGTPGHPVLFPADCFVALQHLSGDRGARDVIRANRHRTRLIPLSDDRALIDLDTPEAWAAWQSGQLALEKVPAE